MLAPEHTAPGSNFVTVGVRVPPLVELRNVEKSFPGRAQPVLTRVSVSIPEGQFAAIVGCSGAGKTTLISLLAGLLKPDCGEISFAGQPLDAPGPERAVVFQNYSLLPWLTVLENVTLAVHAASPHLSRQTVKDHAFYFIDLVKLSAAHQKRPRELSGGMRQRVALARALAMEPRVLLLDEPFSLLDALTRFELQDQLVQICERTRKTILMVTHDVDEALFLADRIVMMTNGPAATIGGILEAPLPRPRIRTKVLEHPAYYPARDQLLTFLESGTPPTTQKGMMDDEEAHQLFAIGSR
jgi:bicarbonate transport system ATP-binding protein